MQRATRVLRALGESTRPASHPEGRVMELTIQPRGEDEQRTLESVEYFEVRSNSVYTECDGESETIQGELYGGSTLRP